MTDDRLEIRELVENWAVWRDAGDWERFRTRLVRRRPDDGDLDAGHGRRVHRNEQGGLGEGRQHPALPRRAVGRRRRRPRDLPDEDDDLAAGGGRRGRGRRGLHRAVLRLPREARRAAGGSCCASRSTRRIGWTPSIPGRRSSSMPSCWHGSRWAIATSRTSRPGSATTSSATCRGCKGAEVEALYRSGAAWLRTVRRLTARPHG